MGYSVPKSTDSPETLEWIKQQLALCDASHACRPQTNRHTVPSRLLHIKDGIRLVHSASPVRYICLTHCWGNQVPLRTVKANILQHTQSIPFSHLPLTFQQTIQFCRQLDIHYLWIDSLCIVQDDTQDWNKEAACMADIYQSAYLVVSASKSSHSLGGLFTSLNVDLEMKQVPVRDTNEHVYFRKSLQHPSNFLDRRLRNTETFPTLTRAWILQERLLPARVLHFGPHEVYWECLHHSQCQCRESFTIETSQTEIQHVVRLKSYFSSESWKAQSPVELVNTWHRLVTDYTRLQMTHAKDAFPAISGIAKRLREVKQCRYIAGLWETSFLQDLLWYAQAPAEGVWTVPDHPWLAPSWSWASIHGPVEYVANIQNLVAFCTLQHHSILLATQNETGSLLAGHIQVKGYILDTTIEHAQHEPHSAVPWNTIVVAALRTKVATVWADYNYLVPGPGCLPSGTDVSCLLVGESSPSSALLLLILVPQGNIYRRVGIAQISKPPSQKSGLQNWLNALAVPSRERQIKMV